MQRRCCVNWFHISLWASMAARTTTSSHSTPTPITSFKPLLLQGQRMRSDSSTKLEATFPLEENALYVILIQNSTCEHLRIEGVHVTSLVSNFCILLYTHRHLESQWIGNCMGKYGETYSMISLGTEHVDLELVMPYLYTKHSLIPRPSLALVFYCL